MSILDDSSWIRLWGRVKDFIPDLGFTSRPDPEDPVSYWREQLLSTVLVVGVLMGPLAYIPAIRFWMSLGEYFIIVSLTLLYFAAISLVACRRLSYHMRAAAIPLILYAIGVMVLFKVGMYSGGPGYIFCFSILAGVLLGLRAALVALAINIVTLVGLYLLVSSGYLSNPIFTLIPRDFWKASGGSFFFLNALATLSVAIQVKGLENALNRERVISQELESKTEELAREVETRRQTEAALRDSQRRLADIIDFLPDPTWVIDRQGKVLAWNRAMEELTGVPARDILGKGDYEYALPFYGQRRPVLIDLVLEPSSRLESKYPSLVRKGRRIIAEGYSAKLKPGGIYVSGIAGPLFDAQGNLVGAIESLRDITARKMAEQEQLERERLLAAIETSGAVCHELNQPLQAIMAKAELMMMRHQGDESLARDLKVIISETERMSEITRRLQRITSYKTKEYLGDTRILDLEDSSR